MFSNLDQNSIMKIISSIPIKFQALIDNSHWNLIFLIDFNIFVHIRLYIRWTNYKYTPEANYDKIIP